MSDPQHQEPIETGATGVDFRLWLATESRRQAELRLASQAATLSAVEARATSLLSWSSGAALAMVAVISQGRLVAPALMVAAAMLSAAICCIVALWPRPWCAPGYDFDQLQAPNFSSELEIAEWTAAGYATGIQANLARLLEFNRIMRTAWQFFALAPAAGLVMAFLRPD